MSRAKLVVRWVTTCEAFVLNVLFSFYGTLCLLLCLLTLLSIFYPVVFLPCTLTLLGIYLPTILLYIRGLAWLLCLLSLLILLSLAAALLASWLSRPYCCFLLARLR